MTEHGGAAALKQNNLAALRSALYHTDFAIKKELAEQCRLSLAACTALLGEMIDDGQVLELAFAASNGGRPARRFSINPNYAHILCLYTANNDVERSGIALRVCDLKGNSLQEKFCPLNDILPEDLTLFITQMVQADLDQAKQSTQEAEQLKSEYEATLQGARDEAKKLIATAQQTARAQGDQITAQAQQQADSMMAEAQKEIERERKRSLEGAQNEIAALALAAASKVVGSTVDSDTNREMVDAFLAEEGAAE